MIEESRNMTGEEENAEIKLATIGDISDTKGKILAVDFGDVRTGIAISDERRSFAFGNCTVSVGGMRKTAEKVAKTAAESKVSAIIIGHPVNMNVTLGPRSEKAVTFALMVAKVLKYNSGHDVAYAGMGDLPVALFDERMTTMAASRYLNETNTRGSKRKGVIDTLSAEIILQNALDRLKTIQHS